jgi:predicted metalloprotease with PDZ domain
VRIEVDRDLLEPPELAMPVWTPGSYLVREYSRHVQEIEVSDAERGKALRWTKTRKNRIRIELPPDCKKVLVTYRVFANELTVRTADVADEHALVNAACVLYWPTGAAGQRARVVWEVPPGWLVASPLVRNGVEPGPSVAWDAASLEELVDSPMLGGKLEVLSFRVLGKPHVFVLEGLAGVPAAPSLVADTTKIIEQAERVFGVGLPYERYQFLAAFTDQGRGGLEHRDCCALVSPRTTFEPRKSYEEFLGLVAHEFFHVWNVKRMRPADLWAVDLEQENYTTLLWVAEGMTSYYDDLLCRRAGLLSVERYLGILADSIADVLRTPGRLVHTLSQASFDAWIKFYRPDENSRNSSHSYYVSGSLAALILDLQIRSRSAGARSLDDAMALLYRSTFLEGRGYAREDVVHCLNQAAAADLSPLVHALVDRPFNPDFAELLAPFGLELKFDAGTTPYFGVQFKPDSLVLANVVAGGPAAAGGLSPGDELLGLNGQRVTHQNWSQVVESSCRAAAKASVLLARRSVLLERTVVPAVDPVGTPSLKQRQDPTQLQRSLQESWLAIPRAPQPRA